MVSMKLAAVHSPTIAPNHSSGPVRAVEHLVDRPAQHVARRLAAAGRGSVATASAVSSVRAEQPGDGGGEDEEGEDRQQRQVGEVAGMDEAVVVDADARPA